MPQLYVFISNIHTFFAEKTENIEKRMNELKQMMLDLDKNDNKRNMNIMPMCLLRLRITLKREKTKSVICTIKRHERRQILGLGEILIRKKKTGNK